jgi:hypothetical protein
MVRKREPTERAGRALSYLLIALGGAMALAIGLFSLAHPFAAWFPGEPRRSDLPPVWGVGLLVIPVVLSAALPAAGAGLKRRGRDSNSRYANQTHNGFRDRRIQPLCHPSRMTSAKASRSTLSAMRAGL